MFVELYCGPRERSVLDEIKTAQRTHQIGNSVLPAELTSDSGGRKLKVSAPVGKVPVLNPTLNDSKCGMGYLWSPSK